MLMRTDPNLQWNRFADLDARGPALAAMDAYRLGDVITVDFELDEAASRIECRVRCQCTGQTGVEMEALTGVQIGLLTIYDMCKAVDRAMVIDAVSLIEKDGGQSGHFVAP